MLRLSGGHAEVMSALDSLRQSNLWKNYWNSRLHERLPEALADSSIDKDDFGVYSFASSFEL